MIEEGKEIEFDPADDSLTLSDYYILNFMVGVVAYPADGKPVFYKVTLVWIGYDFGNNSGGGIRVSVWLAIGFFFIVFILAFLVYRLRRRVKQTER